MRRLLLVAVLVVLAPSPTVAVPPLVAGALATDNVDFVLNIPDVAAIGGRIVDDKLYVTTAQGLRIYDVALGIPVLLGALEIPHLQNENVETNGEIALIAVDHFAAGQLLSYVHVIDVSDPRTPILRSVVRAFNAHTATCLLDCDLFWSQGGDVIDIRDPSNPVNLGRLDVWWHKLIVDEAGIAWVNGDLVFDLRGYSADDPLNVPTLTRTGRTTGGFGWHQAIRPDALSATPELLGDTAIDPGEVVFGTDEATLPLSNDRCRAEGPFRTSWFHEVDGTPQVDALDVWRVGEATLPSSKPAVAQCSAHWFDYHEGVVAIGWYEQGTRFLDVSDPSDIREIGYYLPAATDTWAAELHPVSDGPLPGLYVYTFDVERGLDVLRFSGRAGDPEVTFSPTVDVPEATRATLRPHPEFGWACRV